MYAWKVVSYSILFLLVTLYLTYIDKNNTNIKKKKLNDKPECVAVTL